ncbi:MAG: hypothetical protein R3264_13840, partial [Anaerolineae bacterium]|nr:hypothetical protein [Anaerolineae bacterium]
MEFNRQNAEVLREGLDQYHPGQGSDILDRVFYWTQGHPYLTQKLCQTVARSENGTWTSEQVDRLVDNLFLSEDGRQEAHLQFIRTNILQHAARAQLIETYDKVYKGKVVHEDRNSIIQNYLKLFGLVRAENGRLQVRNNIYRQVFDREWIKANTSRDNTLLPRLIAIAAILILILLGTYFVWFDQDTNDALIRTYTEEFDTQNPTLRLDRLAKLFDLGAADEARRLFSDLPPVEKIALFKGATPDLQPQLRSAIEGVYVLLENTPDDTRLLEAMYAALIQLEEPNPRTITLTEEIEHWLDGRDAMQGAEINYDRALVAYSTAIGKNSRNPATYLERAVVFAVREGFTDAIDDIDTAAELRLELNLGPSATLYHQQALIYSAQEDYSDALLSYQRALQIEQKPAIYFDRALTYAAMGDTNNALATFETVLQLDDNWLPNVQNALKENNLLTETLEGDPAARPTLAAFAAAPTFTATPSATVTPSPPATATASPNLQPSSTFTIEPILTPTGQPAPQATPATPAVAQPVIPPTPDTLIYVQSNYQYHNIGLISSDGQPLNLSLLNQVAAPSWCEQGRAVVFFAEPGVGPLDTGIWIAEFGNNILKNERLLINTEHIQNLSCSPVGDKIAYEIVLNPNRPPAEWQSQVSVIYANPERDDLEIDKFPGKQPAWRNNQELVVNTCEGSACGLFAVQCIGESCNYPGKTQLTDGSGDSYPAVSPDGSRIAFSRKIGSDWDIFLRDETGSIRNLTANLDGTNTTPIFGADGQNLYFRTDTRGRGIHWDILGIRLGNSLNEANTIIVDPVVKGVGPS